MLFTAIGFGAVAVARAPFAIAGTVVAWTFGEMITFPVTTAYVADIAPPGRNGEYMGAFSSIFSLALVVGPWAGVAALDRFGAIPMWLGTFVCGLVGIIFIALTHEPVPIVTPTLE
jgi:MFS family permease